MKMRLCTVWACLACLALFSITALPVEAQESRFGSNLDVNVVTVDVYVTDRDGNPITGLTQEDFEIEEDGRKKRIEYFTAVDRRQGSSATPGAAGADGTTAGGAAADASSEPLHMIVMVDNTNIEIPNRNRVLKRLSDFLGGLDRDDLRVMFVDFGGSVNLIQGFTSDSAEIDQAMQALAERPTASLSRALERQGYMASIDSIFRLLAEGQGTRGEQMARIEADSMIQQVPLYAESAYRDVVEATNAMTSFVHAMAGLPGRKALLYVSDGLPLHPGEDLVSAMQSAFRDSGAFGARRPRGNSNSDFGRDGGDTGGSGSQEYSAGGVSDDRLREIGRLQGEITAYSTVPHFQRLTAVANANRVTFYPINADAGAGVVLGPESGGGAAFQMQSTAGFLAADQSNMRESLRYLADSTGGVALASGTDIDGLLDKVQRDFDAYYSLGYTAEPAEDEQGEYREIEVELKKRIRGADVRYREGYVARPASSQNQDPVRDALLGALVLDGANNPYGLELEAASVEPAPEAEGQFLATLLLRIPIDSLVLKSADGQHVAQLQLSVITQTPQGQLTPVQSMPLTIAIPSEQLEAAKGQFYGAQLPMRLLPGEQKVAVGVAPQDDPGAMSVIGLPLNIGGGS